MGSRRKNLRVPMQLEPGGGPAVQLLAKTAVDLPCHFAAVSRAICSCDQRVCCSLCRPVLPSVIERPASAADSERAPSAGLAGGAQCTYDDSFSHLFLKRCRQSPTYYAVMHYTGVYSISPSVPIAPGCCV